jgi:ribosome-binding protein aMBF1 (putative translation factor)
MTPQETRANVAAAIRGARAARGWTRHRLAAEVTARCADIHPDVMCRLEAGRRRVDVGELVAFADALGVKPTELLEGRIIVAQNGRGAP